MYDAVKMRLERIDSQAEYIIAATETERGGYDKDIRSWAVTKIADEKALFDIIELDSSAEVIAAAIETMKSPADVLRVLQDSKRSVARRYALSRLNDISPRDAQVVFASTAINDGDKNVKQDAIRLIYDQFQLLQVADGINDPELRREVVKKINIEASLIECYSKETDKKVRREIIGKTASVDLILRAIETDNAVNVSYALKRAAGMELFSVIENVALNDPRHEVRHMAVGLIKNPDVLKQVLLLDKDIRVRQRCIQMPQPQDVLENIALDERESVHLRLPAIERLENVDTLKQLRQHTQPAAIREAAARRISALRADGDTGVA